MALAATKTMGTIALIMTLMVFSAIGHAAPNRCTDIAERNPKILNILTINLLFSKLDDRDVRLRRIAAYIQRQQAQRPIDVVLLQEVVSGIIPDTGNSAKDLQKFLQELGLAYNQSSAFSAGLPVLLSVFNSTLSRCEIAERLVKTLPAAPEIDFQGVKVKEGRSALMTRIDIPNYGAVNVYNTHLCSSPCTSNNRLAQGQSLMSFVKDTEDNRYPGDNPVVLGGDLNMDLADPSESFLYDLFTNQNSFIDAYAFANSTSVPPNPYFCIQNADKSVILPQGCTYGVSGISDPLGLITDPKPGRLDYIFLRGFSGLMPQSIFSRVVLGGIKPDGMPRLNWSVNKAVSDHSALITSVVLP